MKVLEEGKWKMVWSMELPCSEKECGAKLLAEEEDVKAVYNSSPAKYSCSCPVCGSVIYIPPSGIPLRVKAVADKSKMNFGSGGNMKVKAWRDIWGAGQGVGQIFDAPPAAEIVARLKAEYEAARAALFAGEPVPTRLQQAAE